MDEQPKSRIRRDFEELRLGDTRLDRRAGKIAKSLMNDPTASFPSAFGNDSQLEAFYRFANNDKVDLQALLEPHVRSTHEELAKHGTVLVVHDKTEVHFSGTQPPKGIGFIGERPAFLLHTAIAVTANEQRIPLGVVGMMPIVRPKPQAKKKRNRSRYPNRKRESDCWGVLAERVESQALKGASLIHVMDREADIYKLMALLTNRNRRFVIRAYHDRRTTGEAALLVSDVLNQTKLVAAGRRELILSERKSGNNPRKTKRHPDRDARTATLCVRYAQVTIRKPRSEYSSTPTVSLWLVQVVEQNPPPGTKPVEWTLLTSERVNNPRQAWRVVDYYRARWRIEEYFKALKTGCRYEKRQFDSLDAHLRVLGLLAPMAWQLLALRSLTHQNPTTHAKTVLRPGQLDVLRNLGQLDGSPTVGDALIAIAKLGGHLKRNGPPGWLTLARGLEKLDAYEVGWIMAQQRM